MSQFAGVEMNSEIKLNLLHYSNKLKMMSVFNHVVSVGTGSRRQEVINCVNPAEQAKQTEAFPAETQTHKLKFYFYLPTHERVLFLKPQRNFAFDVSAETEARCAETQIEEGHFRFTIFVMSS